MMTDKRYKAGIIGLGFIGGADQVSGDALGQSVPDLDGTHRYALENHPRVELVAGSSRDQGRRQRFSAATGARTYADWQELLGKEDLDIVSVATYAPVHAEITQGCARAGVRAVYCEKPIATTIPDAEAMTTACHRAGTLLAINHNRRYDPNHRRLRDLLQGDGLGELTSVNLQWPAGRLGNVGTHMFDALYMLTGRRVEAVSATLDLAGKPDCRGSQFSDPGGWGVMRLEGGLMATVDATDYGRHPGLTALNGSEGRALITGLDVRLEYWDGRSQHWPASQEGTSMGRAVGEIVDWLDGRPFPYAAEEAVHTLEAIVAFHASHARRAAWTELPLQGSDRELVVNSG